MPTLKVLVTGATGFAGCHASAALLGAGHTLRLLVRSPDRIERAFAPLGISASACEVQVGDVTDPGAVEAAVRGCDAVVHSAAVFSLDLRRTAELERTNIQGAESVLGAAVRHGLDPIIHVSSISALWPPSGPVLEASMPVQQPRDLYSRTKAASERFARDHQAKGAPVVTVYPGSIWGPNDPTVGDAIQTVMRFVAAGVVPNTPGGLPVVDVRDLAATLVALMEPERGPRRYMAGGHLLPLAELVAVLARTTGRRFRFVPVPGSVMRALGRLGDIFPPLGRQGITYEAMCTLTQMIPSEDEAVVRELGVVFRPAEETLRDCLRWMLDEGLITAKHAGTLASAR